MNKTVTLPLVVCVAVTVIFSGHYLAAKIVLVEVPALSLAAARGVVGGLLLMVVFWSRVAAAISAKKVVILAGVAALGFCLNQLFLLAGLNRSTPADAALVSSTIPITASLLAVVAGIDRPDPRRLAGIGLGLVVIGWYLMHLFSVDLVAHAQGNLLVFANVLFFSLALLIVKKYLNETPAEVVATGMLLLGGSGMLVAGGSLTPVITFAMRGSTSFALILFETVITTAVAYTLNLWALRRLSIATTTVFNYLQPPTTALLTWTFLGNVPSAALIVAFGGVGISCLLVLSAEQGQNSLRP